MVRVFVDIIKSLDDDCTSCDDVDECGPAIVSTKCFNAVNCGDPNLLLGIPICQKNSKTDHTIAIMT